MGSRVSNGTARKPFICRGAAPCDGPGCPRVPLRTSLVMMGSGVRVSPSALQYPWGFWPYGAVASMVSREPYGNFLAARMVFSASTCCPENSSMTCP